MDQILEKWDEILMTVKTEHDISDIAFNTFLRPLEFYGVTGNTAYILVPSEQLGLSYISKKYYLPLKVAITEITGTEYEIKFILPEQAKSIASSPNKQKKPFYSEAASKSNLNSNYTFDTFVVGSNNRFAHSASLAVAESPGEAYNPLYIYGGPGLGKTHLMHAIGHYAHELYPDMRILYITSEDFTNQLVSAMQTNQNQQFRERFRNVDILMVDDIQFIAGKHGTEEEFFHTFNHLREAGKQIVMTSDKPPKEIQKLEERLCSRFEGGLVADIQRPDFETRLAILRKKAEFEHLNISDDILALIAEKIDTNVRELEGSVTRLTAYSRLTRRPIDMQLAREALRELFKHSETRVITCDSIQDAVANYYGLSVEDLKSPKRNHEITVPRQIAMYLAREMMGLSLTRIGDAFGGRHYTTVMSSISKVEDSIKQSPSLVSLLDDIRRMIKNPT